MKKFFSVFFVVLLLCCAAVPAFAAEGDTIINNNYVNETDLTPVTGWFERLFNSFTDWFADLSTKIANGFNYLSDHLRQRFANLENVIDNAIGAFKQSVQNLFAEIKNKITDTINNIKSIYTLIGESFTKFKDFLVEKIKYFFIPQFSFHGKIEEWKSTLAGKFNFFVEVSNMLRNLFNFDETLDAPKFEFTYKGTKVGLIDFRPYAAFRPVVQGIILALAWFSFLRRMIHAVPDFIMSASGSVGSPNDIARASSSGSDKK